MKNNNSGKRYFEVSLPIPDHTPLVFILKPTNSFLRYTFSVTVGMLIGYALHQIPQAWGGGCVCVDGYYTQYVHLVFSTHYLVSLILWFVLFFWGGIPNTVVYSMYTLLIVQQEYATLNAHPSLCGNYCSDFTETWCSRIATVIIGIDGFLHIHCVDFSKLITN